MKKTLDEVRALISPKLLEFLNNILFEFDDKRPLIFGDEAEHQEIKGEPFSKETNACLNPFSKKIIIFLRRIDKIGIKEEIDIAHELGHLRLLLLGLPSEKETTDQEKQENWKTFFSPLRDSMEHAVYYPLVKNKYQIDLYNNERLVCFIKNQLPNMNNKSEREKLLLMLNFIKYEIESNDHYWLDKLHKIYSEKILDVKIIVDSLLPIIRELANKEDVHFFVLQYRKVLQIIGTHFDCLTEDIWPNFVTQTNSCEHGINRLKI